MRLAGRGLIVRRLMVGKGSIVSSLVCNTKQLSDKVANHWTVFNVKRDFESVLVQAQDSRWVPWVR